MTIIVALFVLIATVIAFAVITARQLTGSRKTLDRIAESLADRDLDRITQSNERDREYDYALKWDRR